LRRAVPLAILALILLSIVLPAVQIPARAATIPLSEIQEAIDLGTQAILNAVRPLIADNTQYYVMPDHPSPTIMVEYNGKLYVPGSFFDPGDSMYKTELVEVTGDSAAWRYYFNVDDDSDYDIVIYARLSNVGENADKLFIFVDKAEYPFTLVLGTRDPIKYYNVQDGWNTYLYIKRT
jgi:hypothetical protein